MKTFVYSLVVAAVVGGAGAADLFVATPPPAGPFASPTADANVELKWDSGRIRYRVCYYTGYNTWVANDFDISQFRDYRHVVRVKVYSEAEWPNNRWDGFRLALYSFPGSVPGSVVWGPVFRRPSRPPVGWSWCNYAVTWTLPAGMDRFAAAFQQYYSYPNCDPHAVDDNATFQGHTWSYAGGRWSPYTTNTPYRNVMLRVVMSNDTTGITPTSFGRVRAMFR
jgi:hypothetical protein